MLKNRITNILRKEIVKDKYDKFIFLCIGTREITGDAIGPTVGDILTDKLKKDNIIILGNKYKELNYININNELKQELKKYKLPYIITIDSALSDNEYTEQIIINKKYLEIGKALNKVKIILAVIIELAAINANTI